MYAFVYRGAILLRTGNFSESIENFNTALKYYDKCPEAHYLKALALMNSGNSATACESLQHALQSAKSGYIRTTIYRDIFNQLYITDIEEQMKLSCLSN